MAKSEPEKIDIIGELLSNYGEMTGRNISREILSNLDFSTLQQGTIHLRRQHVLGGEGCPLADGRKVTVHKDQKSPSEAFCWNSDGRG